MDEWIEQKISNVPGVSKVSVVSVPPLSCESNFPSFVRFAPLVTVCVALSSLVKVTFAPFETVRFAGENAKPLIVTVFVSATGAALDAAGVDAGALAVLAHATKVNAAMAVGIARRKARRMTASLGF